MVVETKKIMGDQGIRVRRHVRARARAALPRRRGRTWSSLTVEVGAWRLRVRSRGAFFGIVVMDDCANEHVPWRASLLAGTNETYVGRLRRDDTAPRPGHVGGCRPDLQGRHQRRADRAVAVAVARESAQRAYPAAALGGRRALWRGFQRHGAPMRQPVSATSTNSSPSKNSAAVVPAPGDDEGCYPDCVHAYLRSRS